MTLPHISSSTTTTLEGPKLRIRTDAEVETWKHTSGYRTYANFLRRLNESVAGYELPLEDSGTDSEVCDQPGPWCIYERLFSGCEEDDLLT